MTRVTRSGFIHRADRTSPTSDALEDLLKEARKYSFEFDRVNPDGSNDPDISNHLELSLLSAIELGAKDRDLVRFYDDYIQRWPLESVTSSNESLTRSDWHLHLGDRRYEGAYRVFFRGEVARMGWEAAIRTYLPSLVYGPAGSAFHAMIRLAYGALREDAVEVSEGLAYWATVTLEFPHPDRGEPFTSRPADVLKRLREDPRFREKRHEGIGLWTRMKMMGEEPDFSPVVDWLAVDEGSMRWIALDSLALFIETDDLRALHAVTGSQALRELLPFLRPEDQVKSMRYLWQAVCAVYGLMGFIEPTTDEKLEELRRAPCPSWEEIRAAAATSLEEHDLKVVFVMAEEELAYGDPLYRYASARRMNLL